MNPAAPRARDLRGAPGYEILFELGQGGMGTAFLARAAGGEGFERLVVIKRLHATRVANSEAVVRFLREARISAAIHHANVAGTQLVGSDEQGPFIVLDYVDGASFAELNDQCWMMGAALPARIALRVALDVLAGLEAVHGATNARGIPLNILHRDVSLENILVGRDGVARLSDFGIARSELFGSAPGKQRYLVGKLPYVAPEYLRGRTISVASDVYALGVALWLALAGHEPWPDADDAKLMRHILDEGLPALTPRPGLPAGVASIVMLACARAVGDRFGSAREMSEAVELLDHELHCVASHREVAAWVEQVMGPLLEQRRARIADLSEPSEAAPLPFATNARQQGHGPRTTLRIAWSQRRRELSTGLGLFMVVAAAGIGWWMVRGDRTELAPVDEPRVAATSGLSENPSPPPGTPIVEVGDVARPPASASTPAAPPSVTRPVPRSRPVPSSEPSLRAPDTIRRTNPYR